MKLDLLIKNIDKKDQHRALISLMNNVTNLAHQQKLTKKVCISAKTLIGTFLAN